MKANMLSLHTPMTPWGGVKRSFSKADNAGSNMVANILPTDTSSTQGVGSKGQTISFSESSHVAYQMKGN